MSLCLCVDIALKENVLIKNIMPKGIYKHKRGKNNPLYGRHVSKEVREKISKTLMGYLRSEETKKKMSEYWKGRKLSEATKKKLSIAKTGKKMILVMGENHWNWKGGITDLRTKLWHSVEYKTWRKTVFERDNYTCRWCDDNTGGNLEAHHIKEQSNYPELRFVISNGLTLCQECHNKTRRGNPKL